MRAGAILRELENLPFAPLEAVASVGPPLVLAPHQDDESLGCGGFLAASAAAGLGPVVVFVTDGSASHPGSRQFDARARAAVRMNEAAEALRILGVSPHRTVFLGLPDSQAPHQGVEFAAAVTRIREIATRFGCRAVLAPWVQDPHGDHVAAHRMAVAVAGQGLAHWSYVVWGWTLGEDTGLPDDLPDGVRLDIAAFLSLKRRAIAAHRSQRGQVFTDDPRGFVLPERFLAYFERPWEVFLREPDRG